MDSIFRKANVHPRSLNQNTRYLSHIQDGHFARPAGVSLVSKNLMYYRLLPKSNFQDNNKSIDWLRFRAFKSLQRDYRVSASTAE